MIVGVDPGKMCGTAICRHDGSDMFGYEVPFDNFFAWLNQFLHMFQVQQEPILVSCERFVITQATARKSSDAHWALEATGMARGLTGAWGGTFVQYDASSSKNFASNDKLQACGWYQRGKGHANDAIRQCAMALVNDLHVLPPWVAS